MRVTIAALLAGLALSGCAGSEEAGMDKRERAEQEAVRVRSIIDELAARVGTEPEVRQDVISDCDVNGDEGLLLMYTVRVQVDETAAERLKGEIADDYEADGWTVRRDPETPDEISVRFLRDDATMGAKIHPRHGSAAVAGSTACIV